MDISEIVINIDHRLAAAQAELTHLTHARSALVTTPAATPLVRTARRPAAKAAKAAKAARTEKAARTAYEVVPVGKLAAVLTESQGMTTRELSRATNGDPKLVLALLKEQESAGELRRTGDRAATRWHAITDEDRIAARAAELTARSKQARARKN